MKAKDQIKYIYKGLPEKLQSIVIKVDDEFRTNPMSLEPGGLDIVVEYTNGEVLLYDKIKLPSRYIRTILGRVVSENLLVKENYLEHANSHLVRVFVKDPEYIEVWNFKNPPEELLTVLKKYDEKEESDGPYCTNPYGTWEESIRIKLSVYLKNGQHASYFKLLELKGYEVLLELRYLLALTFSETDISDSLDLIYSVKYKKGDTEIDLEKEPFILNIDELSNETIPIKSKYGIAFTAMENGMAILRHKESKEFINEIELDFSRYMYSDLDCIIIYYKGLNLLVYKEDGYFEVN